MFVSIIASKYYDSSLYLRKPSSVSSSESDFGKKSNEATVLIECQSPVTF